MRFVTVNSKEIAETVYFAGLDERGEGLWWSVS